MTARRNHEARGAPIRVRSSCKTQPANARWCSSKTRMANVYAPRVGFAIVRNATQHVYVLRAMRDKRPADNEVRARGGKDGKSCVKRQSRYAAEKRPAESAICAAPARFMPHRRRHAVAAHMMPAGTHATPCVRRRRAILRKDKNAEDTTSQVHRARRVRLWRAQIATRMMS